MRFEAVTFDLDGTLVDTVGDLHEAARRTLLDVSMPPRSLAAVRGFIGHGTEALVRQCLDWGEPVPDEVMQLAQARFKAHYAEVNGQFSALYPGAAQALQQCGELGLRIAVVTNKVAMFTEPLLERMGLRDFFPVVISGDSTPYRKPHPQPILAACEQLGVMPEKTLHIGDSRHDVAAARAAGLCVYCVPYGYDQGQPVTSAECDALVLDLPTAIELARSHTKSA